MASVTQKLIDKELIQPPSWLKTNVCYEVITGSYAYGVSGNSSDMDVYGFCVPPKHYIWPHIAGEILGFSKQNFVFNQFDKSHIQDEKTEYDLNIYNIVKYFRLCADNNPNMIDTLFVPTRCVLYINQVGQIVRENRNHFLSKKCWHTFKGYAYAQLNRMNRKPEGKRLELVKKYGYDIKAAYHVVRLLDEVEQILETQILDLERNKEQLKAIRRGEFKKEDIVEIFHRKEKQLEELYNSSTLRYKVDEDYLKDILLECLELHYSNLKDIPRLNKSEKTLNGIISLLKDEQYVL